MHSLQQHKIVQSHWSYISLFALGFTIWGIAFIFNSSYIDPETGTRYFSLFDDAMISMRYAFNLANGNGLVWNPGEYVEGITNLLMTLYMAFMSLLFDKSGAVFAVQLSGIGFVLITAFFCLKIGELLLEERQQHANSLIKVLFFLVPVTYYPLLFWSLMGMENGLLAALISAAVYIALLKDGEAKPNIILPILLGLAFLTRPDAAIPVALIMFYRTLGMLSVEGIKTVFIEGLIISVFVVGLTLFRYFYYGDIYPNTYILKVVGMPSDVRLSNGLVFIEPFIQTTLLPIFLGILSLALSMSRKTLLIVSMLIAMICYQVYVGGDAFSLWRMFVFSLPLTTVVCLAEIYILSSRTHKKAKLIQPVILVFSFVVFSFAYNWDYRDYISLETSSERASAGHINLTTALALSELTTPEATVGVVYAGIVPYYTELPAHDFLGKSDKHIASLSPDISGALSAHGMNTHPGHNKYDLHYSIRKLKPDFIQTYKWGSHNLENYVRGRYHVVRHKGSTLLLKKNSPNILWDKIELKPSQ